jgi:hypothetical protein
MQREHIDRSGGFSGIDTFLSRQCNARSTTIATFSRAMLAHAVIRLNSGNVPLDRRLNLLPSQ